MSFDLHAALTYLVEAGGSDLHIKAESQPLARIDGTLRPLEGSDVLTPDDTEAVVHQMLHDAVKLREFAEEHEVDYSYAIEGLARFRVNAFRQRGYASIVIRAIPISIRSIEDLALPPVVREISEEERGIVLLTGTTGSGKSTTLAAMIDHINSTRSRHVVTIEDPIEFLHVDKRSLINQREVVDRADRDRDRADDDRRVAALAEGVDAEAGKALDRVRVVDLVLLGELA